MKDLALLLRALQLSSHVYHNFVRGSTFFADHEMLAELYAAYEAAYDSVVERLIGSGKLDISTLQQIQEEAGKLVKTSPAVSDAAVIFKALLHSELELQNVCASIKGSIGTMNLVAQLADDSEVRVYKLKQRV